MSVRPSVGHTNWNREKNAHFEQNKGVGMKSKSKTIGTTFKSYKHTSKSKIAIDSCQTLFDLFFFLSIFLFSFFSFFHSFFPTVFHLQPVQSWRNSPTIMTEMWSYKGLTTTTKTTTTTTHLLAPHCPLRSRTTLRSFACSFTHLFWALGEEGFVSELNASISYNIIPLCTVAIATATTTASPLPLHSRSKWHEIDA